MSKPPEHVRENRAFWNEQADQWMAGGERNWAGEPGWGFWNAPEGELEMLPVDMAGMQAIELGCGTGYVSAWMARRGASVVGIDVSERQLATARRLAERNAVELTLVHGNAETVPIPRCLVRLCHQRVRCRYLVRPLRLDPGSATVCSARAARSRFSATIHSPVSARRPAAQTATNGFTLPISACTNKIGAT